MNTNETYLVFMTYDNFSDTGTALASIETSFEDANRAGLELMQAYPQHYNRIRYGSVPVSTPIDLVNEMSDKLFCHSDIWIVKVTR